LWGDDPTEFFVGDANAVSNIAAYDTVRLVHFWWEQSWNDGRVAFRAGRFGVDDDFMGAETAALFVNSAFGPLPILSLNTPAPIWPLPAAAVRGYWESRDGFWIQAGLFDGDGGEEESNDRGWDWNLGEDEGWVLAVETGAGHHFGERTGGWKVGGFYHSGDHPLLADGTSREGSWGIYAVLEQALAAPQENGGEGLRGFLRVGYSPDNGSNLVDLEIDGGVAGPAGLFNRPDDTWGLAFARTSFSGGAQRYIDFPEAETIIEGSYRMKIGDWIHLQPDIQFVFDPAEGADDAVVLFLRVETSF
jgi:porin